MIINNNLEIYYKNKLIAKLEQKVGNFVLHLMDDQIFKNDKIFDLLIEFIVKIQDNFK